MRFVFFLFVIFILGSCENSDPQNPTAPSLTTAAAENITGSTATLGGTITNTGGEGLQTRGVCWGLNANPTIFDNYQPADGDSTGSFKVEISDLQPNTTYHVRAFAQNSSEEAYGNDIEFTTDVALRFETEIVRDIITTRATLKGRVFDAYRTPGVKGFVLGTSSAPTVDDIKIDDGVGEGKIEIFLVNLTPNTTYYVRPFSFIDLDYVYGEEVSFKTAGFFGPAGGYVFYDKGEETDGWRYLEASPQTIQDVEWGCVGNFISGTFPEIGTGRENSIRINQMCNESDCAAKVSVNHQQGVYADYFLPSREEAVALMRSLDGIASNIVPASLWTSTETNFENAFHVYWSNDNLIESSIYKESAVDVIPIRRY
ncbi:MAG: hypothetical protein AAFQ87_09370 [Bacteroidota bacterium]